MEPTLTPDPAFPFLDDEGIWAEVRSKGVAQAGRPALFLDRDGVIVEEVNFLHRPENAQLRPHAAAMIRAANRLDVPVVVVTNQSGIGRSYYAWFDFIAVQDRIHALLAEEHAHVDAVFACPHHETGKPPYNHADHPARKPNPGMLTRAALMLALDLSRSWIVGDRATDVAAGRRGGLAGGVLIATNTRRDDYERDQALAFARGPHYRVVFGPSVEAVAIVLPLLAGAATRWADRSNASDVVRRPSRP